MKQAIKSFLNKIPLQLLVLFILFGFIAVPWKRHVGNYQFDGLMARDSFFVTAMKTTGTAPTTVGTTQYVVVDTNGKFSWAATGGLATKVQLGGSVVNSTARTYLNFVANNNVGWAATDDGVNDRVTITPVLQTVYSANPNYRVVVQDTTTGTIYHTTLATNPVLTEAITIVSTQNYTVLSTDNNISYEYATGGGTLTLPASPSNGTVLWIRNTSSGNLTYSANVYDGASTFTTTLGAAHWIKMVYSTSDSKWRYIANN
jgi:hypothetical protein